MTRVLKFGLHFHSLGPSLCSFSKIIKRKSEYRKAGSKEKVKEKEGWRKENDGSIDKNFFTIYPPFQDYLEEDKLRRTAIVTFSPR